MRCPSVVLVDRTSRPQSAARLAHVAGALQIQVERDFGPVWGVSACVGAARGTTVPADAWPISMVERPIAGLGVRADRDGRPAAEVLAGADWTLAASHVLLEMIADPRGDRLVRGVGVDPAAGRRPVRYLVEVCDPCQVFEYAVDDVVVSDFVTPDYYYRPDWPPGTPVDFLRALRGPLEVPRGCTLAWHDQADRHWYQRGPDGALQRSRQPGDPRRAPRDDRDQAFPADDRHDVAATRLAHRAGTSREPP